jgi:hypothetical protein
MHFRKRSDFGFAYLEAWAHSRRLSKRAGVYAGPSYF